MKEINRVIGFFFFVVLDYLQFTTFALRLCFSYEKQHFVRLFTGTSFACAHSCKNPQATLPLRKTWHLVTFSFGRVIPNTVVKTHNGDNTWRATSWEDSSLLASILKEKEIGWTIGFFFLLVRYTAPYIAATTIYHADFFIAVN